MSKASKIINIFILIFAVAAVTLGTLLFMKREEITLSRKYIADTVEKISSQIGVNRIPASDLHISKKPGDVKEAMVKLETSVDKIVKQRNAISETLTNVTNSVLEKAYIAEGDEAYIADAKVVASYGEYAETLEEIEKKIEERMQYIYVREQHLTDYMKKNGTELNLPSRVYTTSPDNAKLSESFVAMNTKTSDVVARMKAFQTHIIKTTEKVSPDSPELNLDLQEYPQLLNQNLTTVQDYVNAHNSLLKEAEELRDRVKRAESLVGTAETDVVKYKKIADEAEALRIAAEKEVTRLRRIIDPDGSDANALERLNINFALLKNLTGKVVYVNPEYAVFTIDLGTESQVVGADGKLNTIPLPEKALMTVATSMNPNDAKYVCKAQVTRVGAKASSAVVNANPDGTIPLPKVGDVVYFSTSDINYMKEVNAEQLRQYNEARQEAELLMQQSDFSDIGLGLEDSGDDSGIDFEDDFLKEEEGDAIEEDGDAIEEAAEDGDAIEEEI